MKKKHRVGVPIRRSDQDVDVVALKRNIKKEVKRELKREIKNELWEELKKVMERKIEDQTYDDFDAPFEMPEDKPWVNLLGSDPDAEKGIKIKLDWNDLFVKQLRESGITGSDDEQVVQHWLALLLKNITEEEKENASSNFE